jgi:hypothetical protein
MLYVDKEYERAAAREEHVEYLVETIWANPRRLSNVLFDQGIELPFEAVRALSRFGSATAGTSDADTFAKAFAEWIDAFVQAEADQLADEPVGELLWGDL